MSMTLEIGRNAGFQFSEPPAFLDPEKAENGRFYYVDKIKHDKWMSKLQRDAYASYFKELDADMVEISKPLKEFVKERDPSIEVPTYFGLISYKKATSISGKRWEVDPSEYKDQPFLVTIWRKTLTPDEKTELDKQEAAKNESATPTEPESEEDAKTTDVVSKYANSWNDQKSGTSADLTSQFVSLIDDLKVLDDALDRADTLVEGLLELFPEWDTNTGGFSKDVSFETAAKRLFAWISLSEGREVLQFSPLRALHFCDDEICASYPIPAIKKWLLFVNKHHVELEPLLQNRRANAAFSMYLKHVHPEDFKKMEDHSDMDFP